ncbi:iron chelate uptake ABC transporter family permease subunit [Tessaracoccus sp. OS52]|uniref:iron chelate uptake ABC transporter family permease subunit n=1 Tax=Tessaracoccus sp. OS52 TaxID=2886691 RepID=UPI001D0F5EA2|nr:iron chelate uptake ABC transporter family permease subunit [Tessaracoccus sp. OS52]MCC2594575.1 iron chelate uptake ABC transporter family permease subunit [Tessaracoccus sp. OS52]
MTTTSDRPATVKLTIDAATYAEHSGPGRDASGPSRAVEASPGERRSGAFHTARARRRYWVILAVLATLALLFTAGLIAYDNPMDFGTEGFWLIAERRSTSVFVMLIVAVCQAMATVAFQTVTHNRIVTPSIMGFESLYRAIQTTTVYLFGLGGLIAFTGVGAFVVQTALMVALALALYGWLLSGKYANLQVMLLVGIIIGGGLASVSSFMQRLLTPSEFDVLAARTFGSVNNADPSYFPVAVPIVLVAGGLLYLRSRQLNTIALGRDAATNLGVNHRRGVIVVLILCSALVAVSTALVGPMTFLGFLVATLAYQLADTHDHRYVFGMAVLTGFVVLAGAYFVMNHVFYAQGVVSIVIELVGGSLFLFVIMRKGRL